MQYLVIAYNGKESEKEFIYIYIKYMNIYLNIYKIYRIHIYIFYNYI